MRERKRYLHEKPLLCVRVQVNATEDLLKGPRNDACGKVGKSLDADNDANTIHN